MTRFIAPFRHHGKESRLIFQGPELPKHADIQNEYEDHSLQEHKKETGHKLDYQNRKEALNNLIEKLSPYKQAQKYQKQADEDLRLLGLKVELTDKRNAQLMNQAKSANERADDAAELAKDTIIPAGLLINQDKTPTAAHTASTSRERISTVIVSGQSAEKTLKINRSQQRAQTAASEERPAESVQVQE